MSVDLVGLFLRESNAIENVYSEEAFEDSIKAWDYAVDNYGNFGVDYICGIHEKLMRRLNPKIAGKLRRKKVYIGGRDIEGRFVVIEEIESRGNKPRLRKWCKKYSIIKDLDEIKEAHIDFEVIHPFLDGNGRTGRILYNVQRINSNLGIRVFYEKEKSAYYDWFFQRRRRDRLIEIFKNI